MAGVFSHRAAAAAAAQDPGYATDAESDTSSDRDEEVDAVKRSRLLALQSALQSTRNAPRTQGGVASEQIARQSLMRHLAPVKPRRKENREWERYPNAQRHARERLLQQRLLRAVTLADEGEEVLRNMRWLQATVVSMSDHLHEKAKYAASDAAAEAAHVELGHQQVLGGSIRTFFTDKPDMLRIDIEIATRDADTNKLLHKLDSKDRAFMLDFDVDTGQLGLSVFASRADKHPFTLLPVHRQLRLFGVFQPHHWGRDGSAPPYTLFVRADGRWLGLCLAKAVLGHQAVIYHDGGRTAGMTHDDGKRPHVLVLHLSTDPEDRLVAEEMVAVLNNNTKDATTPSKFIHLQRIAQPETFLQQLREWEREPNNIKRLPEFMQPWCGKLDASFDYLDKHTDCIYVPPVVVVLAHGNEQGLELHTSRTANSPYSFETIARALQLLLHTHCPPHLFVFNVCFAGGLNAAWTGSSLVGDLAKSLFPIPFIAYRGAVSFTDLLFGHPFILLRTLSMLYRPLKIVGSQFEHTMYHYMMSSEVSAVAAAFHVASALSPPSDSSTAVMFNAIDPYRQISRRQLWRFWKMNEYVNEGKLTWYTIMDASHKQQPRILQRPRRPVPFVSNSSKRLSSQLLEELSDTMAAIYRRLSAELIQQGNRRLKASEFLQAATLFGGVQSFIHSKTNVLSESDVLKFNVLSIFGVAVSHLSPADADPFDKWPDVHTCAALLDILALQDSLDAAQLEQLSQRLPSVRALRKRLAELIADRSRTRLDARLQDAALQRSVLNAMLDYANRLYRIVASEELPWKKVMKTRVKDYASAPPPSP